MNLKEFLPIGTVVKLFSLDPKIMITGYLMKNKHQSNSYVYYYSGCCYPLVMTNDDGQVYFEKKI